MITGTQASESEKGENEIVIMKWEALTRTKIEDEEGEFFQWGYSTCC